MKETFYFSHDYNARNDDKILELRDKYQNEGYAVYFYILETMAERGDGRIMPTLLGGLSLGYGVAKGWLLGFMDFCVEIGLFCSDDVGYFSPRMIDHLNMRKMLKEKGKEGAEKRWGNSPPISPPNAKESKGKEIKVKEIENMFSQKEILNAIKGITTGDKYQPDFKSPLKLKISAKFKNNGSEFGRMVIRLGYVFLEEYQKSQGELYLGGNFSVSPIAEKVSMRLKENATEDDISDSVRKYFKSKKAKELTITLNTAFSDATWLDWKQNKKAKQVYYN